MTNSRAKGVRGELELAHYIENLGISARRGQQYCGTSGDPDVVADLPGYHLEVKRTEKLRLWNAVDQAADDAGDDDIPVVVHRANRRPWVAIMVLEDFIDLVRRAQK